jgi:hypothetical protein
LKDVSPVVILAVLSVTKEQTAMKIQVAIDPTYPEDLLIDIKAQTQDPRIGLVESVLDTSEKLLGYQDKDVIILDPKDIYFFATENGKDLCPPGAKQMAGQKEDV